MASLSLSLTLTCCSHRSGSLGVLGDAGLYLVEQGVCRDREARRHERHSLLLCEPHQHHRCWPAETSHQVVRAALPPPPPPRFGIRLHSLTIVLWTQGGRSRSARRPHVGRQFDPIPHGGPLALIHFNCRTLARLPRAEGVLRPAWLTWQTGQTQRTPFIISNNWDINSNTEWHQLLRINNEFLANNSGALLGGEALAWPNALEAGVSTSMYVPTKPIDGVS